MNLKSIGDDVSEKTALMRFWIQKRFLVEEIFDDDGSNDENDELE